MKRAAMGFARHQPARALVTKLGKKVSENREQAGVSFASAGPGQHVTIGADVLLP
jgi:hypothetical protein